MTAPNDADVPDDTFLLYPASGRLFANVSLKLGELELHGHVIAAARLVSFLGASARRARSVEFDSMRGAVLLPCCAHVVGKNLSNVRLRIAPFLRGEQRVKEESGTHYPRVTINGRRKHNPPFRFPKGPAERRADDEFSIWPQHLPSIMRFLRRMTGANAKHQTSRRKEEWWK